MASSCKLIDQADGQSVMGGIVTTPSGERIPLSNMALELLTKEAERLDRSLSWVVQRAWRLAKAEIKKLATTKSGCGAYAPKGTKCKLCGKSHL